MVEVGVLEAKTRLSELLEAMLRGEEVIITRHGKRLAKLSRFVEESAFDRGEHVRELREKLARLAPRPEAADPDADLAAMRGRG